MFLVTSIFRIVILVLTDLSMIPALLLMQKAHKHFPLYIGFFQFFTKTLYNISQALQFNIFLHVDDWHFISDVLNIAYYAQLVVHLAQISDENYNILLRYIGFSMAWISKSKDGWDSAFWEIMVISGFFCMLGYQLYFNFNTFRSKIDFKCLWYGISATVVGVLLFCTLEWANFSSDTRTGRVLHAIVSGGTVLFINKA